jgi:hypothetical protein
MRVGVFIKLPCNECEFHTSISVLNAWRIQPKTAEEVGPTNNVSYLYSQSAQFESRQSQNTVTGLSWFSSVPSNFRDTILIKLWSLPSKSLDSSTGIAMAYGLDGRSSIPGWRKRFFSRKQCPDRI